MSRQVRTSVCRKSVMHCMNLLLISWLLIFTAPGDLPKPYDMMDEKNGIDLHAGRPAGEQRVTKLKHLRLLDGGPTQLASAIDADALNDLGRGREARGDLDGAIEHSTGQPYS